MNWAVGLFFALLPLQWFALGGTPLGQARLHQVAILAIAALVVARFPLRRYAPVLRTSAAFVGANLYMVVAIAAVAAYNGNGPQAAVQQLMYLTTFVALAGLFCQVAAGGLPRVHRTLRWAAPVAAGSLVLGLAAAMVVNGVNPGAVLAQTIASADPQVFQRELYRSAFAGFGLAEDEVLGNIRHEVFGSVLLAMLVSTWAMRTGPPPIRLQRRAYGGAMVLGTALLVLSLSRSIVIAGLVWPVLAVARSARRSELSARHLAVVYGSAVTIGVASVTGLGAVVLNRFATDVAGYESRTGLYRRAFAAIPDVWLTGGYDTSGESSHNFVLDTLLRSGVFAAVPAAVIVGFVLLALVAIVARLPRLPAAMVPVAVALVLVLVRLGTSGGGLIPPIEWVALAFAVGVLAAWQARPRVAKPDEPELAGARA